MTPKKYTTSISLESQIKNVIGTRVLFCALFMMLLVMGLTIYDISQSIKDMRSHVNEIIKPLEDFTIGQMMLNNYSAVKVKIDSFNKANNEFKVEWKSENAPQYEKVLWSFPNTKWTYNYKLGDIAGYQFGYFKTSGSIFSSKGMYYDLLIRIGLLIAVILSVIIFLYPLAKKIPQKLFVDPTNRFIDLFSENEKSKKLSSEPLPRELEELEMKIKTLLEREKEHERNKADIAIGKMASQVAHDIRSPLAALNAIIQKTVDIHEDTRIMIRNATQQINDIANNLLVQNRTASAKNNPKSPTPEIVSLLLDTVVSQKRAQYNHFPININFHIDKNSHGIFTRLHAADFKRAVSNLIDNSVEAIETRGEIDLNLSHTSKWIQIDLRDTGAGMSQELIENIMNDNVVSSKKSGHGIGLSSAHKYIQSWGGRLKISSKLKEGTTIHVSLPLISPAYWFLSKLQFEKNSIVVILDDDKSIHDIWKSRIYAEIPEANLQLINLYHPSDLLNYDLTTLKLKPVKYLCDYELLGSALTGIDVIEKLDVASDATLVTSRYEDESIRDRCTNLGVKILPKSYTIYVPIEIASQGKEFSHTELVFIDDNKTLTDAWNFRADCVNKKLETFNAVTSFMKSLDKYSKETIFYIDVELDNGQNGINLAKTLYEKGYQNLYLATGYPKEYFENLYFVKDIVGKNPPF